MYDLVKLVVLNRDRRDRRKSNRAIASQKIDRDSSLPAYSHSDTRFQPSASAELNGKEKPAQVEIDEHGDPGALETPAEP